MNVQPGSDLVRWILWVGVSASELHSGKWYCKRCEPHSTIRSTKVKCFACPQKSGALKLVADEQFCHVVCALWLDGITFGHGESRDTVRSRACALFTCVHVCGMDVCRCTR